MYSNAIEGHSVQSGCNQGAYHQGGHSRFHSLGRGRVEWLNEHGRAAGAACAAGRCRGHVGATGFSSALLLLLLLLLLMLLLMLLLLLLQLLLLGLLGLGLGRRGPPRCTR